MRVSHRQYTISKALIFTGHQTIWASVSRRRYSLIEGNVEVLKKMKDDGFITFQNTTYRINSNKLLISVPEENVSAVNAIIQQLKSELDPLNKISEGHYIPV